MSYTHFINPASKFLTNFNTSNIIGLTFIIVFSLLIIGLFFYYFFNNLKNIMLYIVERLSLKSLTDRQLLINCCKDNIGIILGSIFLICTLVYATQDPKALVSRSTTYSIVIITVLLGTFATFSTLLKGAPPAKTFLIFGVAAIILYIIIILSKYINSTFIKYISILIIFVGLAIVYKIYETKLKNMQGWPGFFANLLFYIPCMLTDGLEYLLQQYKITPNIISVLLIIEVILTLMYFYIPKLLQRFVKKSAIVLQNKPVFLNTENIVRNIDMFKFTPLNNVLTTEHKIEYNRNYAISMWTYVNIQPSSDEAYSKETSIFDFGNGHPKITYKNTGSNKRNNNNMGIYTCYFSNTDPNAFYEVNMAGQKWNFIVFNYFDSKVDLYINGNLERTYVFSNNIPQYDEMDSIKIGSDNGLYGAICNVNYYKSPLQESQLVNMYNLYYNKNPPVDFIE